MQAVFGESSEQWGATQGPHSVQSQSSVLKCTVKGQEELVLSVEGRSQKAPSL